MSAVITAGGALVTAVVVALLGYALGVRKNRLERIIERRDIAIAEIFGALVKSQRACISWSAGADPEMRQAVRENYENFLDCYYTRSIWLQEDTRTEIDAYVVASHDFILRLEKEMGESGRLADGTTAKELLSQKLTPTSNDAQDKLRKEVETGPSWWRKLFGV